MPPAPRSRTTAGSDDSGSGLLSTSFGLLFFLLTLLIVTQVATHLFALSRLRADADHAARVVASVRSTEAGTNAAMAAQSAWLEQAHAGAHPVVTWSMQADGRLRVEVTADSPARAVSLVSSVLGIGSLHATASVRQEAVR